ncbi:transposase [Nitrosomonas sp. Nm132]|nr:transposase [Nitrosomonas sp. Nm132]
MTLLETPLACIDSEKTERVEPTPGDECDLYVLKTGCQWQQLLREFPA